jgi:hypothetical protein
LDRSGNCFRRKYSDPNCEPGWHIHFNGDWVEWLYLRVNRNGFTGYIRSKRVCQFDQHGYMYFINGFTNFSTGRAYLYMDCSSR